LSSTLEGLVILRKVCTALQLSDWAGFLTLNRTRSSRSEVLPIEAYRTMHRGFIDVFQDSSMATGMVTVHIVDSW